MEKIRDHLTQLWWRQGAGRAAELAACVALGVSLTQFPKAAGVGIALLFVSLLTFTGSQLASSDTEVHTSKVVTLAYRWNARRQTLKAIVNFFQRAQKVAWFYESVEWIVGIRLQFSACSASDSFWSF